MEREAKGDPAWATLAELRKDTAEVRQGWTAFLRERLSRWALRWTIGGVMIFLVTALYPDLSWLWWVGAGLAFLSLLVMLIAQWLIARKLARAQTSSDELEATLTELEAAGLLDDEESNQA